MFDKVEILFFLGCYAALIGGYLPTFRDISLPPINAAERPRRAKNSFTPPRKIEITLLPSFMELFECQLRV